MGTRLLLLAILACVAAPETVAQEPRRVTAWAAAHNVGRNVPGLSGGSVRLIVRPTISGQSLRIKLANVRGNAPASFAAAFVGASGQGAAIVADTNRRLTFGGSASLTLAPDESAWSDPVPFPVNAFERLTVSRWSADRQRSRIFPTAVG